MSSTPSHLQCLCGSIQVPSSLLDSPNFPIKTHFCHCNTCRQTSGALSGLFAKLTGSPAKSTLAACTVYKTPEGRVDRYFCSTCGARTFNHVLESGYWSACSGMIERDDQSQFQVRDTTRAANTDADDNSNNTDVSQITAHTFVSDTIDGGLAVRLQSIESDSIPAYPGMPGGSNTPMSTKEVADLLQRQRQSDISTPKQHNRLLASCHCASIQFLISPPTPSQSASQDPQIQRWLRTNGTKYFALNCVCRSDRLVSGFPIASYTYVMPENIHLVPPSPSPSTKQSTKNTNIGTSTATARTTATETEVETTSHENKSRDEHDKETETPLFSYESTSTTLIDFDTEIKSLQSHLPALNFYTSSPEVRRSFCNVCGASVFFQRVDRPQCVNVSVGLLRAKSGCLASEWIEFEWGWTCFGEEANDPGIVRALEKVGRGEV